MIFCRKKPKSKEPSAKRAKVGKGEKVKDPNMPKRPPNILIWLIVQEKKLICNIDFEERSIS